MKKLSIIMPVFNEEGTLKEILKKVEKAKVPKSLKKEIILINDASTDDSAQLLKKYAKKHKVLHHKENKGKGAAIRTGLKAAKGDVILIQDADLEYDPNDYMKLLKPILNKDTQVVYGSRFLSKEIKVMGTGHIMLPSHYIGNRMLTLFTNLLYGCKLTDMETCYKVFTREVLDTITELRARRFDFEPEITAKILKAGFPISEVAIKVYPRGFDEGKKITKLDGLKALYYLIYYRAFD